MFASLFENTDEPSSYLLAKFTLDNAQSTQFQNLLQHSLRLYQDDTKYADQALRWLRENNVSLQAEIEGGILRITTPDDLVQQLRYFPNEIRPDLDRFVLSNNKQRIYDELKRCREEDSPWPDIQYLWELHPVMEWLADRTLNAFGRHTAPILRLQYVTSRSTSGAN